MDTPNSNRIPIPFVLFDVAQHGDIPVVGYIDATTPDLKIKYTHRAYFPTMKAIIETIETDFEIPPHDQAPNARVQTALERAERLVSNPAAPHVAKDDCGCAARAAARRARRNGGKP